MISRMLGVQLRKQEAPATAIVLAIAHRIPDVISLAQY